MLLAVGGEPNWILDALGLLGIPVLVALNGLFVAAEFALVAVRKTRVEEMVHNGVSGAKAVEAAVHSLDRSIAATQLGITIASIALGWVGEPALAHLLLPLFSSLAPGVGEVTAHSIASGLALFAITMMHVVFGELVPKTMALQSPDTTSLWIARPLVIFANLTRPLVWIMNGTANAIVRLCGFKPSDGSDLVHSVEELALLIEDTEEAGILDSDQAEFVQNVFRLSDKHVAACMVPRERMASLELNMPPDKILEAVRSGAHTRMPVYEGDPDNIVGIVNTKDLFFLFSLQGIVVLQDAIYPALFLKPNETLDHALRLFQKARRPMALVRDEEGRIQGVITLEDVLEEIIGDIEDEHDRPVPRGRFRRRRLLRKPIKPPQEVRREGAAG